MKISDVITPREEVLTGDVKGYIQIFDVDDETTFEGSPSKFLDTTQSTDAIETIIKHMREAFREGGNTSFFLAGPFGTGKTHSVIALYHLLNSPEVGNSWLREHGFKPFLPSDCKVGWVSATDDQPDYLWEPLYRRINEEEKLNKATDGSLKPPSKGELRNLVKDEPIAFFIDEIEDWYGGLGDKVMRRNRNFLQNITEVSADERFNLLLFLTFLDIDFELKKLIEHRTRPITINLDVQVKWTDVVRRRLFSDEPDREPITETAEEYSNLTEEDLYEGIFESYPFHPQVLDVLKEIWGPEGQEQGVRNPLLELADAVAEHYEKKDLILVSDLDYDLEDPKSLLPGLDRGMADKWRKDVNRCSEIAGSESVLKTLYAYSLLPIPGATDEEIVQGVVRSGGSRDDALLPLEKILESPLAYHIRERNGKFLVTKEPTVPKMISDRAARIQEDRAKKKIRSVLEKEIFEDVHITGDIPPGIKNSEEFKIIVSPQGMDDEEIEEQYREFKYQNSLTLVVPKAGNSAYDEEVIKKARRVLAAEEMMPEAEVDQEELKREKRKDLDDLKNRLRKRYGRAYRFTKDNLPKPVSVGTNVENIKNKVRAGQPDIRAEIKEKAKEGKKAKSILYDCKKLLSAPIVLEEKDFHDALRALFEDGKIGLDGNKLYHHSETGFPNLPDAMNSIVRPGDEILGKIRGGEPKFVVQSISAPEKVREGEDIELTALIKNEEKVKGEKKVSLELDRSEVLSRSVDLESGDSKDLNFTLEDLEPGKRKLSLIVGGERVSRTVLVEPEEGFKGPIFSISSFEIPDEVRVDKKVWISSQITNEGDRKGKASVDLLFSGRHVDDKQIKLAPEESKDIKLSGVPKTAGEMKILLQVDGKVEEAKTVNVEPKVTFVSDSVATERKIPTEIRELEDEDEIFGLKVDILRQKTVRKSDVEKVLNALPEGTPIKVLLRYRRRQE